MDQYTKPRKYTDDEEINHAYQVTILTTHAIGWNITLGPFATSLGHDYHENTPHHPSDIAPPTLYEVSDGIIALSHTDDGESIYPNPKDKKPYFEEILTKDKANPDLRLALIKVVDQIVVANSPLTKGELHDPAYEEKWRELSGRKVREMKLFLEMLQKKNRKGRLDQEIRLLREGIAFTQLRLAPYEEAKASLETVLFEKRRNNGV